VASSILGQRKTETSKGDSMAGGKGGQARGIAHQKSICFFLCDLDYEREPIYSLAAAKTIERRPVTRRWLGHSSTVAMTASGGALTPGTALMAAVVAWAPPPGDGLAREAPTQWLNRGGTTWRWRLSFGVLRGRRGGVYIGERCSMIRRHSKADFISNFILSSTIIGGIRKGIETSLLRSKTLLWVGVLWPYGLSMGPRAGGGSTRREMGSNTAPAGGGGDNQRGQTRCE
jgi:hypothetical protein